MQTKSLKRSVSLLLQSSSLRERRKLWNGRCKRRPERRVKKKTEREMSGKGEAYDHACIHTDTHASAPAVSHPLFRSCFFFVSSRRERKFLGGKGGGERRSQ